MKRLHFTESVPVVRSAPNRTDVACFVGFVGRRFQVGGLLPHIRRWLEEQGWASPPYGRQPLEALLNVPVPIDSWDVFDQLFTWDGRDLGLDAQEQRHFGTTYLGAAVRSFFSQGGRKCYVVRVGDPWPITTPRRERLDRVAALIPGFPLRFEPSPVDRDSWRGVGHLFGLPDVSFVCLPDLPDAVATDRLTIEPPEPPPMAGEQFVECSAPQPVPAADRLARLYRAPRCDEVGYASWARALWILADMVRRRSGDAQVDVQIVAAVPIPESGAGADRNVLELLTDRGHGPLAASPGERMDGVASAYVQLAYPWVLTPGSEDLPERLECPDAVLTGVLARNALLRGTFRSAANLHLADAYDVAPAVSREHLLTEVSRDPESTVSGHALIERISLLGHTVQGLRVLSDVTTSPSDTYRPASVNRLVSFLLRAARRIGMDSVFEASHEANWAELERQLNALLLRLLQAGALRGRTPEEAFQVTCDRSTMTQQDIDNGRMIAHISFQASLPIERITVVLIRDEGGQVTDLGIRGSDQEAA